MQWVCTGVGLRIASSLQVRTTHSARPSSANVVVVVVSWSRLVAFSTCGVFASRFSATVVVVVAALGLKRLGGLENKGKSLSTKTSSPIGAVVDVVGGAGGGAYNF